MRCAAGYFVGVCYCDALQEGFSEIYVVFSGYFSRVHVISTFGDPVIILLFSV